MFKKAELGEVLLLSSGVGFAERLSRFHKEALPFEVFLAKRAVEALGVVVVVDRLTQRSPASIGKPQETHFVVNNSFQSSSQ